MQDDETPLPWYMPPEPREAGVIRRWVREKCTFRMQAVLVAAVRGCDGAPKNDSSKPVLHALRFDVLNPSYWGDDLDPYNFTSFMGYSTSLDVFRDQMLESLDQYPFHFIMHLMHAAEILGYYHPDGDRREWWNELYCAIVVAHCHCRPEQKVEMEHRLRDR